MGERGPRSRPAAFPRGGWAIEAPIARAEAEELVGAVTDDAWRLVEEAFAECGRRADALGVSRSNRDLRDARGFRTRQKAALRALDKALAALASEDLAGAILAEAADNYRLQEGEATPHRLKAALGGAQGEMLRVRAVVERAAPLDLPEASLAEVRRDLARAVFAAIRDGGGDVRLTSERDGWGQSGLMPFERLILAMGIHHHHSDLALSRWLRRALS